MPKAATASAKGPGVRPGRHGGGDPDGYFASEAAAFSINEATACGWET